MAAPLKLRKQKIFSFSFNFEGGLQSCVRAELTNELLKYILYERQQLPFPFDQIRAEMKNQNEKVSCNSFCRIRIRSSIVFIIPHFRFALYALP